MSDELDIPPFGYRAAYRRGPDPGTRRMVMMAGGFAAALLVVVSGWALLGGGSGTIPTIAAPSGPVKVRPAHPGGLQVSQRQNPTLGAAASTAGGDALGAPPETPNPQALAADLAPPMPPAPASAAPASAARVAAAPAFALPLPPVPPARIPAPTPPLAAAATAPASAASGGVQVQLAALDSAGAAHTEWQRLDARMPALLHGLSPDILKVQAGGKVFWRLRTGHFASIAAATGFCQSVLAAHGHCTIATW